MITWRKKIVNKWLHEGRKIVYKWLLEGRKLVNKWLHEGRKIIVNSYIKKKFSN